MQMQRVALKLSLILALFLLVDGKKTTGKAQEDVKEAIGALNDLEEEFAAEEKAIQAKGDKPVSDDVDPDNIKADGTGITDDTELSEAAEVSKAQDAESAQHQRKSQKKDDDDFIDDIMQSAPNDDADSNDDSQRKKKRHQTDEASDDDDIGLDMEKPSLAKMLREVSEIALEFAALPEDKVKPLAGKVKEIWEMSADLRTA